MQLAKRRNRASCPIGDVLTATVTRMMNSRASQQDLYRICYSSARHRHDTRQADLRNTADSMDCSNIAGLELTLSASYCRFRTGTRGHRARYSRRTHRGVAHAVNHSRHAGSRDRHGVCGPAPRDLHIIGRRRGRVGRAQGASELLRCGLASNASTLSAARPALARYKP